MRLEHIAITINDQREILNFYQNILGMTKTRSFILDEDLSGTIFNIEKETPVYIMQKDKLSLEVFVTNEQRKSSFEHICISIENRKNLVDKAIQCSYDCIRIKRKKPDMVFIKDKCGNVFEITGLSA